MPSRSRSGSLSRLSSAAAPYVSKAASVLGSYPASSTSTRRRSASFGVEGESDDKGDETAHPGAFTMSELEECTRDLSKDPVFRLAQTVLSRASMSHVLESRKIVVEDTMVFSDTIDLAGTGVANQMGSGRCWLFATTNVIKIFTARKHNIKDDQFQLSQSYLYFYDHLEKANWFLEQAIQLAVQGEPLHSRTCQFLFAGSQAQDGGQYDMAVNLIQQYGLVPQSVYPESYNTSQSGQLDRMLNSKLREFALALRRAVETDLQSHRARKSDALEAAREIKRGQMKEIYRTLAICCGTPPKPDEKFVWEFRDKDDTLQRIITTPLEFARKHAGYDVSSCVSLINDPRNAYDQVYTVERLGNVVGGARDVRYINLEIDELKEIAVKLIQNNTPVWFGCDVERCSNTSSGIMDSHLYEYDDAFGSSVRMTKAERLQTGDSQMTHAMMLVAVHLDAITHKPVRWRVQNSWGLDACIKGYLVMSDEWFTDNVFQIVAPRSYVHNSLLKLYDSGRAIALPIYDPFGALA